MRSSPPLSPCLTVTPGGVNRVTRVKAGPVPARGRATGQFAPDDPAAGGAVRQSNPIRDGRSTSQAIDHVPVAERSGNPLLKSTVAQSNELSGGRSYDKIEPEPGTVSYTARPMIDRSGSTSNVTSRKRHAGGTISIVAIGSRVSGRLHLETPRLLGHPKRTQGRAGKPRKLSRLELRGIGNLVQPANILDCHRSSSRVDDAQVGIDDSFSTRGDVGMDDGRIASRARLALSTKR